MEKREIKAQVSGKVRVEKWHNGGDKSVDNFGDNVDKLGFGGLGRGFGEHKCGQVGVIPCFREGGDKIVR